MVTAAARKLKPWRVRRRSRRGASARWLSAELAIGTLRQSNLQYAIRLARWQHNTCRISVIAFARFNHSLMFGNKNAVDSGDLRNFRRSPTALNLERVSAPDLKVLYLQDFPPQRIPLEREVPLKVWSKCNSLRKTVPPNLTLPLCEGSRPVGSHPVKRASRFRASYCQISRKV
jgi:hypothetical protein